MIKEEALRAADEALRKLNSCRPLDPITVERLREEMKLESTYDSNAIEGSRLTLSETVMVVKEGVIAGGSHSVQDIMAARGYAAGWDAVCRFAQEHLPLTVSMVRDLHRYVLLGALPEFCGVFRDHEVRVLGANFKPASPYLIPAKMSDLISRLDDDAGLHPIERAAVFHAGFETIHPFADGNGRTGRLLLNFMLLKAGYWPVNIRFAEDRQAYYRALSAYNLDGNADLLTALIAERAAAQLDYCIFIARQKDFVASLRRGNPETDV